MTYYRKAYLNSPFEYEAEGSAQVRDDSVHWQALQLREDSFRSGLSPGQRLHSVLRARRSKALPSKASLKKPLSFRLQTEKSITGEAPTFIKNLNIDIRYCIRPVPSPRALSHFTRPRIPPPVRRSSIIQRKTNIQSGRGVCSCRKTGGASGELHCLQMQKDIFSPAATTFSRKPPWGWVLV